NAMEKNVCRLLRDAHQTRRGAPEEVTSAKWRLDTADEGGGGATECIVVTKGATNGTGLGRRCSDFLAKHRQGHVTHSRDALAPNGRRILHGGRRADEEHNRSFAAVGPAGVVTHGRIFITQHKRKLGA